MKALVGRNLARARDAANDGEGLSQAQLGRLADVDPQQISKYERGIYMPAPETLAALAAALDRELTWFYGNHEAEAEGAAA